MKKKGRLRGIELLERTYCISNNWSISKLYIELSSLMRTANELCVNDVDVDIRKTKLNQLIGEERKFLQKLIDSSEAEQLEVIIKTEDKEDFHEGDPIPQTPIKQEKTILVVKSPNTRYSSRRAAKTPVIFRDGDDKAGQDVTVNVPTAEAANPTSGDDLQEEITVPKIPDVTNDGGDTIAEDSSAKKERNMENSLMEVEQEQSEAGESANLLEGEDNEADDNVDDDNDADFVDDENDDDYAMDDDDDGAMSDVEAPKEPKEKKRKIETKIEKETNQKKELHQCEECNEKVSRLRGHLKHHIMGKNYMCDTCQLGFKGLQSLQKHIDKKHADQKPKDLNRDENHSEADQNATRYGCKICKRSYLVESYLTIHKRHCVELKCNSCSAVFNEFKELKCHEEAHLRECFICSLTFDTIFELTNHVNKEHPNDKTLTCFKCNSCYGTILELARHGESHVDDEDGIQCIICERSFKLKESLIDHLKLHTGEKPHSCIECSASFARRSALVKHLRVVHNHEKEELCSACGESFPNKSVFLIHSRDETMPRKCPQCSLEFKNCRLLRQHIPRHLSKEERKVFVCQYCGSAYTNNEQLQNHINTHTGRKPYKCSVCPDAFSSRTTLLQHVKSHKNQRSYQCEVCSKMFNLGSDLNRHRRIHTAQKDWKCDICNKSFNQAGNLKVHQRIHSGEKPYKCDVCSQEFMYKGMYNDHLKKHQTDSKKMKIDQI